MNATYAIAVDLCVSGRARTTMGPSVSNLIVLDVCTSSCALCGDDAVLASGSARGVDAESPSFDMIVGGGKSRIYLAEEIQRALDLRDIKAAFFGDGGKQVREIVEAIFIWLLVALRQGR